MRRCSRLSGMFVLFVFGRPTHLPVGWHSSKVEAGSDYVLLKASAKLANHPAESGSQLSAICTEQPLTHHLGRWLLVLMWVLSDPWNSPEPCVEPSITNLMVTLIHHVISDHYVISGTQLATGVCDRSLHCDAQPVWIKLTVLCRPSLTILCLSVSPG